MYTIRQYVTLYAAFLGSMLTGASVMHHLLAPDLTLPPVHIVAGPPASGSGGAGLQAVVEQSSLEPSTSGAQLR